MTKDALVTAVSQFELSEEKIHLAIQSIDEYVACYSEWEEVLRNSLANVSICLKSHVETPYVLCAADHCQLFQAPVVLALIYRPNKSLPPRHPNHNSTMNRIVLPALFDGDPVSNRDKTFNEELLAFGGPKNSEFDLKSISIVSKQPDHWICANYSRRVLALITLRALTRPSQLRALWVGGPDAEKALGNYIRCAYFTTGEFAQVRRLDVKSDHRDFNLLVGTIVVVGCNHPSVPLYGDPVAAHITRCDLELLRGILVLVDTKRTDFITADEVISQVSEIATLHQAQHDHFIECVQLRFFLLSDAEDRARLIIKSFWNCVRRNEIWGKECSRNTRSTELG